MSELKESLEFTVDSLKRVKNDRKVTQLMDEINYIQFLPTKINHYHLCEGINTGNLHTFIQQLMSKIYITVTQERDDRMEREVILPAAIFAMTGIANSNGLSIYAFYRWLTTANLTNLSELPVLIQFTGKSSKSPDKKMVHHAFGFDFNLDAAQYNRKYIDLPKEPQYKLVDFCLKECNHTLALNRITTLFSKIDRIDYILPLKIRSLDLLISLQKELPIRFKATCEKLRNAILAAMEDTSPEKFRVQYPIDIKIAHGYLRTCYLKRRPKNDLYAGEIGINVLSNIELVWNF